MEAVVCWRSMWSLIIDRTVTLSFISCSGRRGDVEECVYLGENGYIQARCDSGLRGRYLSNCTLLVCSAAAIHKTVPPALVGTAARAWCLCEFRLLKKERRGKRTKSRYQLPMTLKKRTIEPRGDAPRCAATSGNNFDRRERISNSRTCSTIRILHGACMRSAEVGRWW
jgi:hypothetical protein